MLNEDSYFDFAVKPLFDSLPGFLGCKDRNSKFIYANQSYAQLTGLLNPEDVVGRTDFDFPCDTIKCAEVFQAQDQKVMQSANIMKIIDVHRFADGQWRIISTRKFPLFNSKKEIMGVVFQGLDITNDKTMEMAFNLYQGDRHQTQKSYVQGQLYGDVQLSNRQSEVLFYLMRGKTIKRIAAILGVSPRTVDEYLEQLRLKFNVHNKHDLIDKAFALGYMNFIPNSFFHSQFSIEL